MRPQRKQGSSFEQFYRQARAMSDFELRRDFTICLIGAMRNEKDAELLENYLHLRKKAPHYEGSRQPSAGRKAKNNHEHIDPNLLTQFES